MRSRPHKQPGRGGDGDRVRRLWGAMTTESPPVRPPREYIERDAVGWISYYLRPYMVDELDRPIAMAAHHAEFWSWAWQIGRGQPPMVNGRERSGIIAVWPREGAKSTTVEMAVTALAARGKRIYALYVCAQQSQADDHVQTIGDMMTAPRVAEDYPLLADRAIGAYGPKSWRRSRLMSASGFTIDALGLDTAMRGIKIGRERPDLIILDDIDDVTDSAYVTGQKRLRITRSLLPAGSRDTMVIGVQNLVLRGGIFDRLVHGQAGFLQDAIVLGPTPALLDCAIERVEGKWRITRGTPTWPAGQPLSVCQAFVDRYGHESFLAECQHEVLHLSGLIHGRFSVGTHRWPDGDRYPQFVRLVGGLDFGSEGATANASAGLVAGVTQDGRLMLLSEFKANGADIAVRQAQWMRAQETLWRGPGSIQWAGDGTEHLGLQLLRTPAGGGFNVTASRMGGQGEASREARVRAVGRRLALDAHGRPGLMYVNGLDAFVDEMESYKRAQAKFEGDRTQPKILRTNDHLMSALEYLVELVDGGPGRPDPNSPSVGSIQW